MSASVSGRARNRPVLAALCLATCAAATHFGGCAGARTAHRDETSLLTKEYVAEVIRYLYRWHADETMLASVAGHRDSELWVRPIHPRLDRDDHSLFHEVLFSRVKLRIVLKKADYLVEELGERVRNDSFKIYSVGGYSSLPASRADYTVFRFDRDELSDYLFRTRNERVFPDAALRERLRAAVREAMGERPADAGEGPAVVYFAPLSPVSNDLWVYWENGHRIIRFSSDADLTQKVYWDLAGVNVQVYDLHENVVVSLDEAPGSNKFVTRDWAARVLFNCIALGQKLVLPAAE